MPTPTLPKQLSIKVSGTAYANCWVAVRNLNTKEYKKLQANSSGEVIFDLQELSSNGTLSGTQTGLTVNDLVEVQVDGGDGYSSTIWTATSKGSAKIELSQTARSTTNTVGVSI